MRRQIVAAVFGVSMVATPAYGQSPLRGEWKITQPNNPRVTGTVSVDADRRATLYAPMDAGRPANFRGYVASVDSTKAELVFTDGTQVAKTYCTIQSSDLLHCRTVRADETLGSPFVLARTKETMDKLWRGKP